MRAMLTLLVLALVGATACAPEAADPSVPDAGAGPIVFVSVPFQAAWLEQLAGPHVRGRVLLSPGDAPHTYSPTPQQMDAVGRAELLLTLGLPFEDSLVPRLRRTFPALTIVDASAGIQRRRMEAHDHDTHGSRGGHHHEGDHDHGEAAAEDRHGADHGHGGHGTHHDHHEHHEHAHHGVGQADPHVWMNPKNATVIVRNMRDALIRLDPQRGPLYRENCAELVEQLEALDRELQETLEPVRGQTLFVYHPAFGYFADRYGLKQVAIEVGGGDPTARQLAALIEQARRENVHVIFVQPQFTEAMARKLAEAIGGAVVSIDPLARDYEANLRRMAGQVARALGGDRHGE